MTFESTDEPLFSKYGVYEIVDSLELNLPKTTVKFSKMGNNVFSYWRRDSEDKIEEKIIPTKSEILKIELCPIRALNHPARRTAFMYLNFEKPIFLEENSAATVFALCPIEIGVFLISNDNKESLDWFTCNPGDSRFGLYGSPESGILCKFSTVPIVSSHQDSIPYLYAVIKMMLKNNLAGGRNLSKIIFNTTEFSIYYENSNAIYDNLIATIKKDLTIQITDISKEMVQTDWARSPSYEGNIITKPFEMDVE